MEPVSLFQKFQNLYDQKTERIQTLINETFKTIPIDLLEDSQTELIFSIFEEIKTCYQSDILPYYNKLLESCINKEKIRDFHPSFAKIISQLTVDELTILENIHKNNYEFVQVSEYTRGKGFFNAKYEKFDYPQNELLHPDKFDFYISHLQDILNLIQWPIYNQIPLSEAGKQTGLIQHSKLIETQFGKYFSRCLFE